MQLKLDPLELRKLNPWQTDNNSDSILWIYGDSRARDWNFNYTLGNNQYEVKNLGIGGQTSGQILLRLRQDLEKKHPEIIIFQLGINDLKCLGFMKEENITKNCINNIISIFEICKQNDIIAVYTSIFPAYKAGLTRQFIWEDSIRDSIIYVNKTVKDYCYKNSIPFFDSYNHLVMSEEGRIIKKEYTRNFLHVNRAGYQQLTEHLNRFLSEALGKNYTLNFK